MKEEGEPKWPDGEDWDCTGMAVAQCRGDSAGGRGYGWLLPLPGGGEVNSRAFFLCFSKCKMHGLVRVPVCCRCKRSNQGMRIE
jgi:hypothetical protein